MFYPNVLQASDLLGLDAVLYNLLSQNDSNFMELLDAEKESDARVNRFVACLILFIFFLLNIQGGPKK